MKLTLQLIQLFLVVILLTPLKSLAHPHSWVEMKTEIEGTTDEILGFKMQWTFDAMSSVYMLDGYDLSPASKELSFQIIADSVINNMLTEHYFTYFYDCEEVGLMNTPWIAAIVVLFALKRIGHPYLFDGIPSLFFGKQWDALLIY
ncbi:DUF1007 family protein [Psychromonas antarctica]|uniref:DUF1007 family protein n=1 Tax=Psychromonas antarctica TaxID=67573 RepID=UPI001EE8A760|nr:DUF1007 family protein [Psychromonas antarctica]MCG6201894.1 DUF1007 family protein [Psychromonas antarctica]